MWFASAYPVYAIAFILLMAVPVVGEVSLGARRWLNLHVVRIQPSEIMKIGLVLALARYYHGLTAQEAKWSWKLIVPALMILLPVGLVAKQPDLGTAILLALTGAAVMILAGLDMRVVMAGALGALVAVPPFVMFVMHGYQRDRILTFLHPEQDPSGAGYHILQSEIALGSGGLLGKGFGLGSQSQLDFLPEKHTDFIFATVAEEFGFIGCFFVLALFCAVITDRLAHRQPVAQPLRAPRGLWRSGHLRPLRLPQRRHGHGPGAGGRYPHAPAQLRRHGDDHGDDRLRPGAVRAHPPLHRGVEREGDAALTQRSGTPGSSVGSS